MYSRPTATSLRFQVNIGYILDRNACKPACTGIYVKKRFLSFSIVYISAFLTFLYFVHDFLLLDS